MAHFKFYRSLLDEMYGRVLWLTSFVRVVVQLPAQNVGRGSAIAYHYARIVGMGMSGIGGNTPLTKSLSA